MLISLVVSFFSGSSSEGATVTVSRIWMRPRSVIEKRSSRVATVIPLPGSAEKVMGEGAPSARAADELERQDATSAHAGTIERRTDPPRAAMIGGHAATVKEFAIRDRLHGIVDKARARIG